ncbi:MAG: hypothetical protein O9346_05775 [Leptospiraceae bacterium]|nr:hypothetical protein [Leptospiraceae bacterium]MCZ8345906.1 hypothetical protein [Leptospiraceae bacterium]
MILAIRKREVNNKCRNHMGVVQAWFTTHLREKPSIKESKI